MIKSDNLVIKKKAGGTITDRRPVFSPDGRYLCVIEKEFVHAYNTATGDSAFKYFPPDEIECEIVGIGIYNETVIAVSSNGFLFKWNLKTGEQLQVSKLSLPHSYCTVIDLHVFEYGSNETHIEVALLILNNEFKGPHMSLTVWSFNLASLKKMVHFTIRASDNINSVSFGGSYNNRFVAAAFKDELTIYKYGMSDELNSFKLPHNYEFTVVRTHPIYDCVAAGNSIGRIEVYYDVTKKKRAYTQAHFSWHILPVGDLLFSPNGTQMISGGGECTMVQWNLKNPMVRHFLPRLPAPIVHFSTSPVNSMVALSLQNNSIVMVNSQLNISGSIEQFTWGLIPVEGQEIFPAGMCYEPNRDSLVLNGRPGHLQFYSLKKNALLFNFDVTNLNYLTQERGTTIFNVEVTRFAISQDGRWIATIQSRDSRAEMMEIVLKFWNYNHSNHTFELNTYCDMPHQDSVNAIKFQPVNFLDSIKRREYCLITTGNDKKFKVWITNFVGPNENKRKTLWRCDRIGFYKDYPAGPAGFSSDGSVLAVGFGPCLSIWDVDNHEQVASLTRDYETLMHVEIEQKNYSHLAVSASKSNLYVWNLMSLTMLWTVPLDVSILVADPLSDYMAVFTRQNSLYVFKPSDSKPVEVRENVCPNDRILSAVFVPQNDSVKSRSSRYPNWMQCSLLYFITSNQNLFAVETSDFDNSDEKVKSIQLNVDDMLKTPYASLIAKQTTNLVQNKECSKSSKPVGRDGGKAIAKLLSAPLHTMPQIRLFCHDFLKAFVKKSNEKTRPTTVTTPKSESKKKRNKHIEKLKKKQKEELERLFSVFEPMDVDNEVAQINGMVNGFHADRTEGMDYSDVEMNGDILMNGDIVNGGLSDEDGSDEGEMKSAVDVPINKMYMVMKREEKKKKKDKKRKMKNRNVGELNESGFYIEDAPDLGLLNLFQDK